MRSGNPTLNDKAFERQGQAYGRDTMTIDGTVNKAFIMLVLLMAGAFVAWNSYFDGGNVIPFAIGGAILGFVLALVISFVPKTAPYLAPVYAVAEGVFLGAISANYAALNLVLDFDFIENGARQGAPKYMEWYGAFGLLVTLVWLYLEIVRLLAKIRSRD